MRLLVYFSCENGMVKTVAADDANQVKEIVYHRMNVPGEVYRNGAARFVRIRNGYDNYLDLPPV